MTSFIKRNKYFFLIISLFLGSNLFAQPVSDVVKFADTQFKQGNFEIANKEYNRALFFGSELKDIIALQIAHCYAQLDNYKLAADFYDKAYSYSLDDSIKNEAILGKAYCLLLEEKFVLSIGELLNFSEKPTLDQQINYHFLKGIAHFGLLDDSLSYYELNEVLILTRQIESNSNLLKTEFDKIYHYHKRYNPKRAYIMSGIIPGSGQFSVGAIKDGINSMLLIGGLYLISVKVIQLYSFWDAVIGLFPWIQRYYLGGMDKSKALAISKIEQKRFESYVKIMDSTTPTNFK